MELNVTALFEDMTILFEYIDGVKSCMFTNFSLLLKGASMVVLNSRDWSEIIWLPENLVL